MSAGEPRPPPAWMAPALVAFVLAVVGHAAIDGRGRGVYLAATGVGVAYVLLDRVLRRALGDEMAAKRALQIMSAVALSVTTTAALVHPSLRVAPLTGWSEPLAASLAIELGVTAASLLTTVPAQRAIPALLLHHALLLLACDFVARTGFGTGVAVATLFQETTNVGWYLHWILNSPETAYHKRAPRLFNVNAVATIAWYAVGRFGVSTPLLVYLLWLTPRGAPWPYLALFTLGLPVLTWMNVQNLRKLAASYPRNPSSWLAARGAPRALAASAGRGQ